MDVPFNPIEFVNRIGEKLVMEFDDASVAGTPGLIGAARENPARKQLEKLMSTSVSVGSGILVDSFGGRSTQQDIVIYERDFCPVYSINDTAEATFFPIEGVIAAGEVKSTVDKDILFDALNKLKSTKVLKRFSQKISRAGFPPGADYRFYGTRIPAMGSPRDEFTQENNFRDQIFTFIICRSFKNSSDAVLGNLIEFAQKEGSQYLPNIIVSLHDGFVQNCGEPADVLMPSPMTANSIAFCPEKRRAFTMLVKELTRHASEGRTVPVQAFDRYISTSSEPLPPSLIRSYV